MRRALLLPLALCGCLRPIGFPWLDASTGASTGETTGDSSTGASSSTTEAETGGTATASGASSTTDATSSADESTTGEPAARCGDAIVQGPLEECDDGNDDPDDGCNLECARDRLVFITSMEFKAGELTSLKAADDLCKQLANKADLPRPFTFVAWLSDSSHDARDRVFLSRGRYVRVDQGVVARDSEELLSGTLQAPIAIDELGAEVKASVWTGTRVDGTRVPGSMHCEDWTSSSFLLIDGYYGISFEQDGAWTFDPEPLTNPTDCNEADRLYCFEGE